MITYDADTDFEPAVGTVVVEYGYASESIVMTVADFRARLGRAADEGFQAGLRQGSDETHAECAEREFVACQLGIRVGYRSAQAEGFAQGVVADPDDEFESMQIPERLKPALTRQQLELFPGENDSQHEAGTAVPVERPEVSNTGLLSHFETAKL